MESIGKTYVYSGSLNRLQEAIVASGKFFTTGTAREVADFRFLDIYVQDNLTLEVNVLGNVFPRGCPNDEGHVVVASYNTDLTKFLDELKL